MKRQEISVFWFRRDLRLHDNAALFHALKSGKKILPIFIFDLDILNELDQNDPRVLFIWEEVKTIKTRLENRFGSSLRVFHSTSMQAFQGLMSEFEIFEVYTNRDYEPKAQKRDRAIYQMLQDKGIRLKAYKDHVIFDRNEIVKNDGSPYAVYTPYMKKWKLKLEDFHLSNYPSDEYLHNLLQMDATSMPGMTEMGFEGNRREYPSRKINLEILDNYASTRDLPYLMGTSRLGVHIRFGTISIRHLAKLAISHNEKYLEELIWRDFYQTIIYHYPSTVNKAFKPAYDRIEWETNNTHFQKWCEGKTGYPIVDAGMRELNETGFMHNRVRMVTASFLCKHLLLDWRLGEAYFASKLLDYDQASNVGGWQWAAGCGVDAAPYFRVFNPTLQQQKFDPHFKYVKRWVQEFGTGDYPAPIVDHKMARERAILRYKQAIN